MPLTAQSWDIQLARAAAYEKLSIFRASLHDIVRQNQKLNKKLKKQSKVQESLILTSLITKISVIEFYVAKIEAYMRRKHESILKVDVNDANSSEDDSEATMVTEDTTKTNKAPPADTIVKKSLESENETDLEDDLEFYDKLQRKPSDANDDLPSQNYQSDFIEFGDFMEPHLVKTGHIIPLSCGHNAAMSKTELTLYEIHLTNAGFIQDFQAQLMEQQQRQTEAQQHDDQEDVDTGGDVE